MTNKKSTYNQKSRKDISNPYHSTSHNELLRCANVKKYDGNYEIKKLENGRIVVRTKNK